MILRQILVFLLLSWTRPSVGRTARELQFDSLFDLNKFKFTEYDTVKFVSLLQNNSFWSVNRFISDDDLTSCQRNVQSANQNDDFELSPDEYSIFVDLESDGEISMPFAEMRLVLIATFYGVACNQCYGSTQSDNCCVGSSAVINIRRSNAEQYAETTRFLCATVQQAIADTLGMPTEAPTPLTEEPTSAPKPTTPTNPTSPSSSTRKPTRTPQAQPSASATEEPTKQGQPPAAGTTSEPTRSPVTKPTTGSPTASPTKSPAAAPTDSPTPSPTLGPSASPMATTTTSPTNKPTLSPASRPTIAPTLYPKKNVTCVTFFYSIQNSAGFSADDILTENGNSLKTGLEVATWETLIYTLNQTSNATNSSSSSTTRQRRRVKTLRRTQEEIQAATKSIQHNYSKGSTHAMDMAISDYYGVDDADRLLDNFLFGLYAPVRNNSHARQRHGRRQLTQWYIHQSRHRTLAYATQALPPNITNVIEDPFCPQPDQATLECAIVVTDVCVVLENGDDEAAVQQIILSGFQTALSNGDFFARVPSENLIT